MEDDGSSSSRRTLLPQRDLGRAGPEAVPRRAVVVQLEILRQGFRQHQRGHHPVVAGDRLHRVAASGSR